MASQSIRLPSTGSTCSCSTAAPILSRSRAGPPAPSSWASPLCVLSLGGRDGLRSVAAGGASLFSSGASTSTKIISSRSRSRSRRRKSPFSIRAGIRAVETYDASFQLQPEADKTLRESLSSTTFCTQVAAQSMQSADVIYEFTGELFQPVPWSPTTKFGMPVEFEKYLQDKENYTVINVPPNFMFKAKIFKPSRLCAVFKRVRSSS